MNITEQITNSLKQAIDKNTTIDFVYIKLTKKRISCWINKLIDSCYCINVENYLKGYECILCEIGYLTYPSEIECDFTTGEVNLWESYCSYNVSGVSNFTIPVFLYIQNNRFGLAYSNGTILNIFGDSVQEIIDNLNTMCNNNPNFKLHLDEKFTNLLNKD